MPGMTTAELARALAATLRGRGDVRIGRVVVDSRKVGPGDLFVALPGARTDGHAFLGEAQQAGAGAALVQPDRGLRPPGLPVIIVPDTLGALADLARYQLGRLSPEVVGITGTVGKTTAKDFLAHLLGGPEAGVHAAPASFNSEIGLPLAILAAPEGAQRLILEYGVNGPGEMRRLLAVARPRHAWLTALGPAHLEGLGSLATVVAEKSLLPRSVPEGGLVWMPRGPAEILADDAQTWCGRVVVCDLDGGRDRGRVVGRRHGAWTLELPRLGVVEVPVLAHHEAVLAATAARAALDLGVSPDSVVRRLSTLVRPPGRLTPHRLGPVTVIDDSYNASPQAVAAALEVLVGWPGAGRRVAVLGTMHELGSTAEGFHREIGARLAGLPVDLLLAVGRGGAWVADAAREAGARCEAHAVDDAATASAALLRRVQPGDVILLKASRAEGLEILLPALEEAGRRMAGARHPGADRVPGGTGP